MGGKLTPRQQAQLAWLESLHPKLERAARIIEQMATMQADESQVRSLGRMLMELKAQAGSMNITALAEGFGTMATMLRRTGGLQLRVRGLRELLAGAKINLEGAIHIASTPERDPKAADDPKLTP